MTYRHNQTVEVIGNQEPYKCSYYPATLLAAIGKTRYLVRYQTRFTDDKSRLLTESLRGSEIRPVPPEIQAPGFAVGERVEVCANGGWWVGRVDRSVDSVYYVRLDGDGSELRCPLYRVRKHLEWDDGKWVCSGTGSLRTLKQKMWNGRVSLEENHRLAMLQLERLLREAQWYE
ncbi:hypothetical protein RHMOL_Rhmol02G0151400 [Rhododendron molle]|uniref:Uncharacterized protein n=1 Tax=Rhododendron molle TaxID=49168 RepID=A0ACC0PSQ2_RHOML|nr:hypothetical protein RHMOL_Rhmol02G0151400 [Rhododendron molle]